MKTQYLQSGVLVMLLLLAGCSTTRPARDDTAETDFPVVIYGDRLQVVKYPLSLADFLIQVPGVQVAANKVIIRGQHPPLFVIDNVQVGHNYVDAQRLVSVFDIQSIEVLRDLTETVRYGSEGVYGVIIIRTWMPEPAEKKHSSNFLR